MNTAQIDRYANQVVNGDVEVDAGIFRVAYRLQTELALLDCLRCDFADDAELQRIYGRLHYWRRKLAG